MSFINYWMPIYNLYKNTKKCLYHSYKIKISKILNCNILKNKNKNKNKETNIINPHFMCIAIRNIARDRDNQIIQCYNNDFRHHNHIRYAYFDLDTILNTAWNNKDTLLVRIISNQGKTKDKEITRFNIDFTKTITKTTIINRESFIEIIENGDKGDLILRIPLSSECGGTLVFSYYRN